MIVTITVNISNFFILRSLINNYLIHIFNNFVLISVDDEEDEQLVIDASDEDEPNDHNKNAKNIAESDTAINANMDDDLITNNKESEVRTLGIFFPS